MRSNAINGAAVTAKRRLPPLNEWPTPKPKMRYGEGPRHSHAPETPLDHAVDRGAHHEVGPSIIASQALIRSSRVQVRKSPGAGPSALLWGFSLRAGTSLARRACMSRKYSMPEETATTNFSWSLAIVLAVYFGLPLAGLLLLFG